MGKPAARIGDMHVCPMFDGKSPHVGGPIAMGEPTVLIGGVPAARVGDICTCMGPPDAIAMGSAGVMIGGKPAARMGDQCAHGGKIVAGLPTVLIGEAMAGLVIVPMSITLVQIQTLITAAKDGTPFCEKCAEAAAKNNTPAKSSDASVEPSPESKSEEKPKAAESTAAPTAPNATSISEKGLQFIASWEQGPKGGAALKPYDDGFGYMTIGYGHLILPGEDFSKGITQQQALDLLRKDSQNAANAINSNVKTPLNQSQFDALASYVFNTGSLKGTKLLEKLNSSDYAGAVSEMDIVTANGKVVKGLVTRRNDEHEIFNNGVYNMHK